MVFVPLAERVRPRNLSEFIGQKHLLSYGAPIDTMLQNKAISNLIFWGPPGVGKTTLAYLISKQINASFVTISAVNAGVAEMRKIISDAQANSISTLLFVDEIHRFNKNQQDALLHAIETGIIILIGATTENPMFEINKALLSRCQVYKLKELSDEELIEMASSALAKDEYLSAKQLNIVEWEALLQYSQGDGRKLLNTIELIGHSLSSGTITNALVLQTLQDKTVIYDKNGEEHYNVISAFIKSIRGSDPNAAIYYLARMLEAGEKPEFIARRLVILASEDIGNANPTALVLASATFTAVQQIGMPEGRIVLSQCVIYLATSTKSNAAYNAINAAQQFVKNEANGKVPLHLVNNTKFENDNNILRYKYPHDYANNFVEQEYLPQLIAGTKFFEPGKNPRENEMREFLKKRWKEKYGY